MAKVKFYSFWKPEEIRPPNKCLNLMTFGIIEDVVARLTSIPGMESLPFTTIADRPLFRLLWKHGDGVFIMGQAEMRKDKWLIFGINAVSSLGDSEFSKLFVQVNEHFGCVVLDEVERNFFTVGDFKKKISKLES